MELEFSKLKFQPSKNTHLELKFLVGNFFFFFYSLGTMVLKTEPGIEPFFLIFGSTPVFGRFSSCWPVIDRFWGF